MHIIIFDEIDAICKSRGRSSDSTGVGDSVVNQLLSKIDGVDALNNILLIGMTNRLDMIDEALLRPGRLEVHVEINLPDEKGRVEIMNIHTEQAKAKGYLDSAFDVSVLAAQTKNFSGAEIEGLVRSATSFAFNRKVDVQNIGKSLDISGLQIMVDDFELALSEVKPAFGQHVDEFEHCARYGVIPYSPQFTELQSTCMRLVDQVRKSQNTPLLTLLLAGNAGVGKTALAAYLAKQCDYPFVRRIAAENYVGYSDTAKISAIAKIFDDAYKSSLSLIVIDDIERLMDFVRVGPRFSNAVLQALFNLLRKQPPKVGRRLMVIGTTSTEYFLDECELTMAFNVIQNVPELGCSGHVQTVLQRLPGFTEAVASEVAHAVDGKKIPVRQLLLVAEMALQRSNPVTQHDFIQCLSTAGYF